jgi:predicted nucleotidyltransferase
MIRLIDDTGDGMLQRIASQAIAVALAEGRIPWAPETAVKVERYLMGVLYPCPHALSALEGLLQAREIKGGLRLDSVLRRLLDPFQAKIDLSFMYGSTARLSQRSDSDIDLFVVGEVRLKDLALALAEAEQVVGRPIYPVLYTKGLFLKKLDERDPFILQVLKGEKVILGGTDDELRTVASKSIPHRAAVDGSGAPPALVHR